MQINKTCSTQQSRRCHAAEQTAPALHTRASSCHSHSEAEPVWPAEALLPLLLLPLLLLLNAIDSIRSPTRCASLALLCAVSVAARVRWKSCSSMSVEAMASRLPSASSRADRSGWAAPPAKALGASSRRVAIRLWAELR